jgi:hypothetical protein
VAFIRKEIKQRNWDKKKESACMVDCGCGCGEQILNMDDYGRPRRYISGHNNRIYTDKNGHKKAWVARNRKSVNKARTARSQRLKIKLISNHTTGQCLRCGLLYDGLNGAVFSFHHRDPEQKEIGVGSGLMTYAWDAVVAEITKCDLVCSNCHLIIHRGEY